MINIEQAKKNSNYQIKNKKTIITYKQNKIFVKIKPQAQMGRKKIQIQTINDERLRNITFNKRKAGLLKKAAELSMLCNIKVCLAFTDVYGNLINFFSPDAQVIDDFKDIQPYKRIYTFTREDYPHFFGNKKKKGELNGGDGQFEDGDNQNGEEGEEDEDEDIQAMSSQSKKLKIENKPAQNNNQTIKDENNKEQASNNKQKLKISIPESNNQIQRQMEALKQQYLSQQQQIGSNKVKEEQQQLQSQQDLQSLAESKNKQQAQNGFQKPYQMKNQDATYNLKNELDSHNSELNNFKFGLSSFQQQQGGGGFSQNQNLLDLNQFANSGLGINIPTSNTLFAQGLGSNQGNGINGFNFMNSIGDQQGSYNK
ncbi:Transcription factor, MADS-box [Pseudocohnilembus persalinus]|uniref:Transcription factor, MADS-box n=1 Tax=Pseudocohnilembus persalinus TaxID=266149 RepID=A0A0V0R888_PSEPJ|nr:Transcription factor, MADS-box [Pseudocohnilembus persalinus]|eukprot:KRX10711.1 Transcription factor, MADS-box [Pseudocohnilembus persalinus]